LRLICAEHDTRKPSTVDKRHKPKTARNDGPGGCLISCFFILFPGFPKQDIKVDQA